jgi:predicted Abi (CAAX) family protease
MSRAIPLRPSVSVEVHCAWFMVCKPPMCCPNPRMATVRLGQREWLEWNAKSFISPDQPRSSLVPVPSHCLRTAPGVRDLYRVFDIDPDSRHLFDRSQEQICFRVVFSQRILCQPNSIAAIAVSIPDERSARSQQKALLEMTQHS